MLSPAQRSTSKRATFVRWCVDQGKCTNKKGRLRSCPFYMYSICSCLIVQLTVASLRYSLVELRSVPYIPGAELVCSGLVICRYRNFGLVTRWYCCWTQAQGPRRTSCEKKLVVNLKWVGGKKSSVSVCRSEVDMKTVSSKLVRYRALALGAFRLRVICEAMFIA